MSSTPPDSLPPAPPASPGWWRRRVIGPLLNILKQGLTPKQLSLTVSLGVIFGLVPMMGITTLMGTFAAVRLRLNVAALLLISHLLSPVQLLLLVPLIRWGAQLLGDSDTPELSLEQLEHLFINDWRRAVHLLWQASLGALLIWAVASIPVGLLLNFGLRPVFRWLLARYAGQAVE